MGRLRPMACPQPMSCSGRLAEAMLLDRYDLPLSTRSSVARDAYVAGCDLLLSMYPGALQAFDRAIEADPDFAFAHIGRAQSLLLYSDFAEARAARAKAGSLAARLPAREASHVGFFLTLADGDGDRSLAALLAHIDQWPRDAMVLTPTAFTNGLIGSSGEPRQKQTLLALLDRLAPHYGDDWWFTAHHAMAQSENGQHAAAEASITRSLAQNPRNGWGAHARGHLSYETGAPLEAIGFLADWISEYPADGLLYSHLNWHLALAHLELGAADQAMRLYHQTFALPVHCGAARSKITDGASFLWRWELAGHARDDIAWRELRDFANQAVPAPAVAFSDLHIALTLAANGDDLGRYKSAGAVTELARGFAAFEGEDFAGAIDALAPIVPYAAQVGGSHAQLDLLEFTLLKAYLHADRQDDATSLLAARRPGPGGIPVASPTSKEPSP